MSLRAIKARSLGRLELLAWVNSLLESDYSKVEHLGDGVAYLQVLDAVFRDAPLHKLDFDARDEKDKLANLQLVQDTLIARDVKKEIPVRRLAKCKFADNHEMLAWCYDYVHRTYPDSNHNYRAREARERAMATGRRGDGGNGRRRRGRASGRQRGRAGERGKARGSPGSDRIRLTVDTSHQSGAISPQSKASLSPGNSNLLPSNHLNNSLRPGLIRSPPKDAILGAGSPPMLDLAKFSGRGVSASSSSFSEDERGVLGGRNIGSRDRGSSDKAPSASAAGANDGLRESRIPVSKRFFSNIYQNGSGGGGGNGGAESNSAAGGSSAVDEVGGSASTGMRGPAISDSSLYAGLAECNLEASEDPQEDASTAVSPRQSADIQAQVISKIPASGSPGGFLDRLEAAVRESSPKRQSARAPAGRRDGEAPSSRRSARDFVMRHHSEQALRAQQRAAALMGNSDGGNDKTTADRLRLRDRIQELESALTKDILSQRTLEDAVESVRVERDFYFDTLRAIEGALQRGIAAQPELGGTTIARELLDIMESRP